MNLFISLSLIILTILIFNPLLDNYSINCLSNKILPLVELMNSLLNNKFSLVLFHFSLWAHLQKESPPTPIWSVAWGVEIPFGVVLHFPLLKLYKFCQFQGSFTWDSDVFLLYLGYSNSDPMNSLDLIVIKTKLINI